jgi:large subunit ribosomal protein L10
MKREEKKEAVLGLQERFSRSKMVILTNYKGLNVEKTDRLRRELREISVEYKVVKNSLLKLASKGTDLELMDSFFIGPTALALSYDDDPISPARILTNFSKDYPDLQIKTGVLNGTMIDSSQISSLASLPSQKILLGKLLGSFISTLSGLMGVLSGVLRKFVHVLEAIKAEREKK